MSALKPNKPACYDGKRDEFVLRSWIFQVQQYLSLMEVGKAAPFTDCTKISFACTYLTGTAATWWFTRVASNAAPATWNDFEAALVQEFVPYDSVQRSRDKLRRLVQRTSVSTYLSEFRNTIIAVPGMNEGEKVDRFVQGLKPQVRLEVMKAGVQSMKAASRIALNVDSAIFGSRMFQNRLHVSTSVPTPMEIGNMEQKRSDIKRDACFKCHKVGCRPWKCRKKNHVVQL